MNESNLELLTFLNAVSERINKDLLQRIIECFMANEDYPESLKLDIIHAIDDGKVGIDE